MVLCGTSLMASRVGPETCARLGPDLDAACATFDELWTDSRVRAMIQLKKGAEHFPGDMCMHPAMVRIYTHKNDSNTTTHRGDRALRSWHMCSHAHRAKDLSEDSKLSQDQCPATGTPEHADMQAKHDEYMTIVGALLYLAACTRPDIAYSVSVLARFVSNPAIAHYAAMQRLLIYVRDTATLKLTYKPNTDGFSIYSDASWEERFSTSGALYYLDNCLVAWYSRLQRSVTHSSAEAEYIGASMAAREGLFHRDVLTDLRALPYGPTILYMDSKSAIDMTFDPVAFKKTKHILRDAHFLRDMVARLFFKPKHVASADMLADILTKPLPRALFVRLRGLLNLVDSREQSRESRRG